MCASVYTCWIHFQWPFSSSCAASIHIFLSSYSFFFPVLFLESICLIFKRKNADNLPIYKYFETSFAFNWYWNSRGPCFGRKFLSSLDFVCIWKDPSLFAFGHLHQPFLSSDLLCRYVSRIHMHWITHDKKTWMKQTNEKICGRELRTKSEAKKTEMVWTCRNIQVSVGNRNSSLRSVARSFGPIILHYISPQDSFAFDFLKYCSWWRQAKLPKTGC